MVREVAATLVHEAGYEVQHLMNNFPLSLPPVLVWNALRSIMMHLSNYVQ